MFSYECNVDYLVQPLFPRHHIYFCVFVDDYLLVVKNLTVFLSVSSPQSYPGGEQ